MSNYNLVEKQKPFKPAFNTNKITLEAKFKSSNFEITEFVAGTKKLKKFKVKKGDILSAFKEAKKYLLEALKADKIRQKKTVK